MKRFSGISRIVVAGLIVWAAVVMPWVCSGRGGAVEGVRVAAKAEDPCCCGGTGEESGTCCCAMAAAKVAEDRCCDACTCTGEPQRGDKPAAFVLLGGLMPLAWKPMTPVEVVTAPASPVAAVCRVIGRSVVVTETAERLARTCVRTT